MFRALFPLESPWVFRDAEVLCPCALWDLDHHRRILRRTQRGKPREPRWGRNHGGVFHVDPMKSTASWSDDRWVLLLGRFYIDRHVWMIGMYLSNLWFMIMKIAFLKQAWKRTRTNCKMIVLFKCGSRTSMVKTSLLFTGVKQPNQNVGRPTKCWHLCI